jgi:hypothetical protein
VSLLSAATFKVMLLKNKSDLSLIICGFPSSKTAGAVNKTNKTLKSLQKRSEINQHSETIPWLCAVQKNSPF